MEKLGSFAQEIFLKRYALDPDETWPERARAVSDFVAGDDQDLADDFYDIIVSRRFMPGGRYLAQSGSEIPQLASCFLFRAGDSREAWADLLSKHMMSLSTGGGCGTFYGDVRPSGSPIKKFGGTASGPISLMDMMNEVARPVLAGGKRRSALWAGLPWNHGDIENFIVAKNWSTAVRALKEQDWNFPARLDMTNISVCLDDEFFERVLKDKQVWDLYYRICKSMCKSGEPGFSVNVRAQSQDVLRNACQPGWATVLTPKGIRTFNDIDVGSMVWGGSSWTEVVRKFSTGIREVKRYYTSAGCFVGTEDHHVMNGDKKVEAKNATSLERSVGPTLSASRDCRDIVDGLVLGDGGIHKASGDLVILYIGDNDQEYHTSEIKNFITKHRPGIDKKAWEIRTSITADELPHTYQRHIPTRFYQGNISTKLGFLRGLYSANGTVSGTRDGNRVALRQSSYTLICQVRDMLYSLGIRSYITTHPPTDITHSNGMYTSKKSYELNITADRLKFQAHIGFIQQYKTLKIKHATKRIPTHKTTFEIQQIESCGSHKVFNIEVAHTDHTYWTGGVLVSNCTEVTSSESGDACNLGSVNFARIKDIAELNKVTRLAVKFLYLGTTLSWLPHEDFRLVRERDRRIGLGLLGLHEWCLRNGERYEPSGELGKWLSAWEATSDDEAVRFSRKMKGPKPIAVRAIAPSGTISIIAETTSGIEPIPCTSYKRRYLVAGGTQWATEYVIDPTTKRLLEDGTIKDPNEIEDAVKLSRDVERRIRMQAFVQSFVDQGIASTINLPEWGEPGNNNATKFAKTLLEYLPKLRGITVYPDNSRPGQPITPVKWETALKNQAVAKEDEESCAGGVCSL